MNHNHKHGVSTGLPSNSEYLTPAIRARRAFHITAKFFSVIDSSCKAFTDLADRLLALQKIIRTFSLVQHDPAHVAGQ